MNREAIDFYHQGDVKYLIAPHDHRFSCYNKIAKTWKKTPSYLQNMRENTICKKWFVKSDS